MRAGLFSRGPKGHSQNLASPLAGGHNRGPVKPSESPPVRAHARVARARATVGAGGLAASGSSHFAVIRAFMAVCFAIFQVRWLRRPENAREQKKGPPELPTSLLSKLISAVFGRSMSFLGLSHRRKS